MAAVLRRLSEADFRTATDARLAGLHDLEVLAIAAREGRLLVTSDRQTMPKFFGEFINKTESPGVIVARRGSPLARMWPDLDCVSGGGVDEPHRLLAALMESWKPVVRRGTLQPTSSM